VCNVSTLSLLNSCTYALALRRRDKGKPVREAGAQSHGPPLCMREVAGLPKTAAGQGMGSALRDRGGGCSHSPTTIGATLSTQTSSNCSPSLPSAGGSPSAASWCSTARKEPQEVAPSQQQRESVMVVAQSDRKLEFKQNAFRWFEATLYIGQLTQALIKTQYRIFSVVSKLDRLHSHQFWRVWMDSGGYWLFSI
jgi:hypothetical protein